MFKDSIRDLWLAEPRSRDQALAAKKEGSSVPVAHQGESNATLTQEYVQGWRKWESVSHSVVWQGKTTGVGAISFSRESFWPRDRTQVSCITGRFFTILATREAP